MKNKLLNLLSCTAAVLLAAGQAVAQEDPFITDARELLSGQSSGVVVSSSPGAPGMTPSVYIHGLHYGFQEPVYIVDGVRVRSLDNLAPESLEKCSVLTGTQAMVLYGPSAANGAIVITTKRTKYLGFHANYDFKGAVQQLAWEPAQATFSQWSNQYPLLTLSKNPYLENRFGTSFAQVHNLDLSYDSQELRVAANVNYLDNDGPLEGRIDTHGRISGTVSLQYRPQKIDWFRAMFYGSAGSSRISNPTLLPTLLQNKPLFPDDETADPFISLQQRPKKTNLTGNVILDFKPLSDLTIRPNVGFSRQTERSYQVEWGPETAQINDIQICDWSLLQYGLDASYNHWFKDNSSLKLDLTLRGQHESTDAMKGLAYTRKSYDELWLKKYDYDGAYSIIEGLIEALKKMSIDEYPFGYYGSIRTENYKADWFDGSFRMAFDWKRYLNLNAGLYWLRSSTGAAEHGYFVPVAGASWNIKRTLESMDIYVFPISNWDLGASWSGTNRYNSAFAAAPTRFQEPFLYPGKAAPQDVSTRFEINSSLNLDLTESLLSFRVSWYDDRDDYSFQTSTNDNLLLTNRGWLFDVNLQRWSGPVQYSFGASLSLYENQCLEMPQMIENFPLYYEQNSSTLVIHKGKPLGIAYLYPSGTGLDEWPYAETRQFLGNGIFPTSVLALHASLTWKNWSFTARAHGNFGQSIQRTMEYVPDPLASYLMDQGLKYNELTRPAYRTPEFSLFDGSFFRIDQIRLDYSLHYPHTKLRWNLFVSLENFFLFTSYPGTDPEYTLNWDSAGIDLGTYPSTRRIVFGTKIDL